MLTNVCFTRDLMAMLSNSDRSSYYSTLNGGLREILLRCHYYKGGLRI